MLSFVIFQVIALMMGAARTSETSVDIQYTPEDSELRTLFYSLLLKLHPVLLDGNEQRVTANF
jgi:hypothetical protein